MSSSSISFFWISAAAKPTSEKKPKKTDNGVGQIKGANCAWIKVFGQEDCNNNTPNKVNGYSPSGE